MTTNTSAKNNELGDLVASARKAQSRSARDVAREAEIDIHTMTKLEQGHYASPSPVTLKGVSKALSIPILELFRAAGYVTPYDLLDMVTNFKPGLVPAEQEATEARSRYIAELIEKHGLDYTGPEFEETP